MLKLISILVFLFSCKLYFGSKKFKLLQPSAIDAFILLNLITTIIGVFSITIFDIDLSFGINEYINDDVKDYIFIEYFLSWSLTLYLLKNIRVEDGNNEHAELIIIRLLYIIGLVFIIVDFLWLPEYPILKAIFSDNIEAAQSRGLVIEYQINNGIPLFNLILRSYPTIVLGFLYYNFLIESSSKFFYMYLVVYIIYNLILLNKAFFITPILMMLCINALVIKKNIRIKWILIAIITLIPGFYLLGNGNYWDLLHDITYRLFIAQMEGAYLIVEKFKEFDVNALLYGFPFAKILGIEKSYDPSVEVVKIIFPGVQGWVNMNSYYVGQGSVMLGWAICLVGPILVFINIYLINKMGKMFKWSKKNGISSIITIYFILTLPVNTNFSLILYFKPFFSALIVLIFTEVILGIIFRSNKKNYG